VWDVDGEKYLDMMAGYSALNFGHSNPEFIRAAKDQLDKVTLTSRAYYNDQIGPFCKELAEFCGQEMVLPMNSGAEAVETALKCARRWGYQKKKVPENKAEIICFEGNFAGRTISLVSFSDTPSYTKDFGPFTPGFKVLPYGDFDAVKAAVNENTVAILLEPIQGEGGIIIPPDGFLKNIRKLCDDEKMLMLADEVQTGFFRTGKRFACDHENVTPDLYIVGKSLGGGIVPISAVIGTKDALEVFEPGSHGSTFGGNPFACAIARSVIGYMKREPLEEKAMRLGMLLKKTLLANGLPRVVSDVRIRGLMCGIDIDPKFGAANDYAYSIKDKKVLTKDTRSKTLRLTPPLVISEEDLSYGVGIVRDVLNVSLLR
jgi:ornithine--oxo-acid transaminase